MDRGEIFNLPSKVCCLRSLPVAGLRLAEKRSLPCPNRNSWIAARDDLYEEIMHKAWDPVLKCFGQSYEETSILDSSVLIMPLVFFMQPVSRYTLSFFWSASLSTLSRTLAL